MMSVVSSYSNAECHYSEHHAFNVILTVIKLDDVTSLYRQSSCWVSLFWMSHFISYAECHYAEYYSNECHNAECYHAECHYTECPNAECHYTECCNAHIHYGVIVLSVIMLTVFMLSVIMLSVIMLIVFMLSVIMLSVIWINVVMLNVVIPSITIMSVVMMNLVMLSVPASSSEHYSFFPDQPGRAGLPLVIDGEGGEFGCIRNQTGRRKIHVSIALWYFTWILGSSNRVNKPGSTSQKYRANLAPKLPEPILFWKWLLLLYLPIRFLDPDRTILCTI
jgi:hypothetical protein